ncbi:MAG: response regulator [Pseudomonadota bacterium]
MDSTKGLFLQRPATAKRPLLGITALVVEDSRFASEAIRLLCLRSGARIRRADSLAHAERHLKVYRPGVIIVDIGLPDGSGLTLIDRLSHSTPRVDVILGSSGDDGAETAAMAAGADGFLPKPVASLATFQDAILAHLPRDRHPPGPRLVHDELVEPDKIAYQDDLSHVAAVLDGGDESASIDYITQFLGGVARSAEDLDLGEAVEELAKRRAAGDPLHSPIATLAALVQSRLSQARI